jgi:hypothetical protein
MKKIASQTWCLTASGERVPEGHPLARVLLVGKGCEIEESQLEAYKILEEPEDSDAEVEDDAEADERWPSGEPIKRPRGRPRKLPISE